MSKSTGVDIKYEVLNTRGRGKAYLGVKLTYLRQKSIQVTPGLTMMQLQSTL